MPTTTGSGEWDRRSIVGGQRTELCRRDRGERHGREDEREEAPHDGAVCLGEPAAVGVFLPLLHPPEKQRAAQAPNFLTEATKDLPGSARARLNPRAAGPPSGATRRAGNAAQLTTLSHLMCGMGSVRSFFVPLFCPPPKPLASCGPGCETSTAGVQGGGALRQNVVSRSPNKESSTPTLQPT